jgi:hypothetical protein
MNVRKVKWLKHRTHKSLKNLNNLIIDRVKQILRSPPNHLGDNTIKEHKSYGASIINDLQMDFIPKWFQTKKTALEDTMKIKY